MNSEEKISIEKALKDFKASYEFDKDWLNAAAEDFEFTLGKQWEDVDVSDLKNQGVMALTINKIRPSIWLLTGLESQNRTDWAAFPEGQEDSVLAEIATRLLKNVSKTSGVNYKISQIFEEGLTCGKGWIEPYLDYTFDLLNGEMKFKKLDYNQIYIDPSSKEYDASDANYACKVSWDVSEDDLISLFPESEAKIRAMEASKINLDAIADRLGGVDVQRKGYKDGGTEGDGTSVEKRFDLLEYYYKKMVPVYHVLDRSLGKVKIVSSKEDADTYAKGANENIPNSVIVKKRMVPEIWVCAIVGGEEIDRRKAWSYPGWNGFPFIPFYCYRVDVPIASGHRNLVCQGIARGLKDVNRQYNKRKTQELRHLNQSANSGWISEENTWVDRDLVKKFGASAGVILEYKMGKQRPEKIMPTPLSQGHAQLAAENTQDMKELSGINADLLAMQEGGQASGRAISLRQRQGLVMVQKVFDNLSQSKWIIGKFMLSQLASVFDLSSAARVLGEKFVMENFSRPIMAPVIDPRTGQPIVDPNTGQPAAQPMMGPDGMPQMEIDQQALQESLTKVLQDTSLGKYDIAIGESATNETIKYANYTTLLDMIGKGIPIPPDVLIEESQISAASKQKIKASIEQQQQMAQAAPKGKPQ